MALAIFALLTLITPPASAATWYAGEFLAVGTGPAAISQGGAVIASVSGPDAIYWNAAGLGKTGSTAFTLEHADRFGGIVKHDAFAGVWPLQDANLGVSLFRGAIDGIIGADSTTLPDPTAPVSPENMPDPDKTRIFSNTDYVLHIAYGRHVRPNLRVGGSVKLISRTIDGVGAFGYGLDLGTQYDLRKNLTLAVAAHDLTATRISWDTDRTDIIHPTIHVGVSWTNAVRRDIRLTTSAGAVYGTTDAGYGGLSPLKLGHEDNPAVAGIEVAWREMVMLRLGSEDLRGMLGPGEGRLTAGVGLRTGYRWIPGVKRLGIDLSWMQHTLDNSYRLGAVIEF
jgi:hypothetical protein